MKGVLECQVEKILEKRVYLEIRYFDFVNGIAATDYSYSDVIIVCAFEYTGWDNLHLIQYTTVNDKIWYIKDINGKNMDHIAVALVLMKRS